MYLQCIYLTFTIALAFSDHQFDDPVLDAALELMDRGEVGDSARRSPVAFVRTISAQVKIDNKPRTHYHIICIYTILNFCWYFL